jgi:NADH-quinone oxidoreductase subunit J
MRILMLIMTALLAFGAVEAYIAAPGYIASADPIPESKLDKESRAKAVRITKRSPHGDRVESQGKGMALLFWAFAAASVGGALFVVTRRNLIAATMGMVGSFLGIAAIYMMLYAHFLSVVQMLVYAGAIMVLFVFVIMILNRPEDEPVAPSGRVGQVIGGLAIVYLVGRLVMMLVKVQPPNPAQAQAAPLPTPQGHDWGSVRAVGTDLFGPGLFVFEAISILLLIAVVGAIAIARPLHEDQDNAGEPSDAGPKEAH